MIEKIKSKPVIFSIILTFLLTILWIAATLLMQGFGQPGSLTLLIISASVNITLAVLATVLMGMINGINGLKYAFKTKGLKKGLKALIPTVPFVLFGLIISMSSAINTDNVNIAGIPLMAIFAAASAFMQTALFRGLLATALFVRLSGTERERIRSAFSASALFLIMYVLIHIFSGNHIEAMQLVNTFVMGAAFCAAYLYSRNLMCLILLQGIWQFLSFLIGLFIVESPDTVSPLALIPLAAILILMIGFAVRSCKRAEPFRLSLED